MKLEYGEYRELLDIVGKYAMVLERGLVTRANGFYPQGDMSADEMEALMNKDHLQVEIEF